MPKFTKSVIHIIQNDISETQIQTGYTCPRRFCPAQTEVWMILRKSCPVLGLKIKMAPLIGFVVKLPSNVCKEEQQNYSVSEKDIKNINLKGS